LKPNSLGISIDTSVDELNGGELRCLGYWMDAYDKNKNIVVEYDEPYHRWKNMILKDNTPSITF
jgi:hypothetical protein